MVYCFLAQGFEEIEALTPVDILRRAGVHVITVGIGKKIVIGAHGISIEADIEDYEIKPDSEPEMIILPGGMPGTLNLETSETVRKARSYCIRNNKYIAAICAAPIILGHLSILTGKTATCYTGFENDLIGANVVKDAVCVDGKIITARGAGVSMSFALKLAELLTSKDKSRALSEGMLCEQ